MIAESRVFEAWYQETLAALAKQLGADTGKEAVRELLEDNGFEFVEEEGGVVK